ncbi:glyoxalase-like domain protein [Geobacter sp. OR-1]|uniref:VOC family protein n=1 Tax=Geobacter sp. OR-1 TaxID=1266765 RepID=UPI000543CC47|nr:VOC family protein [Geobacter sp. OR-1]GAM09155.1 glyoxalase-like domain protein [Geobacter sp. OR-1]
MVERMKNVVVFVKDTAAAKKFYKEQLQLPVANETDFMIEFFPGATSSLGVATALHEAAFPLVGRHTGITLQVNDLDSFCKRLIDEGVAFAEPLEQTPWGKMAVVKDPDGNQIALVDR